VVGGGVTGLTAALRVARAGAEAILFDRQAQLGGEIRTERVEGFVIEAGADSFLTRKPRGLGLCKELGLAGRLIARRAEHAGAFVRHRGTLHPLPEGLSGMIPTRLDLLAASTLLSREGRAAIAQEREVPAPHEPAEESIAQFITRRFGREVYEHIVEPLMAGIYGGDGDRLSLDATFPQLREFERRFGSVGRGLASRQEAATVEAPPFVSFPGGMAEMIEHMAARLGGAAIRAGAGVASVESRAGDGFTVVLDTGATELADAVILATPAAETARMLQPLDPELSELHDRIEYASAVTVNLAFRARDLPRPVNGYGYVVPRVEGSDVVACTIVSNKWTGRAPEGYMLFRIYLRGRDGRNITLEDDDALAGAARRELESTYGVTAVPALVRVSRWPAALPQYTRGHGARVARIRNLLERRPGLFLAGASYAGVGIPDCIASGEAAADAAMALAAGCGPSTGTPQ
jgi:oxygen-dependent protoporphyrinogen oxidase